MERLYTLQDLSASLGKSEQYLQRLIEVLHLPYEKRDGSMVVTTSQLQSWLVLITLADVTNREAKLKRFFEEE
jgi:hypothetical protein